ncbi:MAG: hypothetical protein H7Y15_19755 [Pseudonocardia sp.]|nr:hypothetical protein [Pseudonocardia sp.]
MTEPEQLDTPTVLVDFEVTGGNLDTLLAAARRDLATLLGPDRHIVDPHIVIGVEESISDGTGVDRIIMWNATITGRVADGSAPSPARS